KEKRDLPWRHTKDPYCIWISEIMLQQTRVEAVKEYYYRFLEALPTVIHLADAPEEQVLKLWEGLGYYSRARNLKKAAEMIKAEFHGVFPNEFDTIRKLPGIGDYTAGAISSIAFDLPTPAVDGNVLRVISRVLNDFSDIMDAKTKARITEMLSRVYPKKHCGDVTQSLMELGATVCIPNGQPKCEVCPLSKLCRATKEATTEELPVKSTKAKRKTEQKTVFLLQCGEEYALRKRAEKGLLFGMWEFPNREGHLAKKEVEKLFPQAEAIGKMKFHRHIFTHIEWELEGYHIIVAEKTLEFVWESADKILEKYAIPAAFQPFWKQRK
ncbi:MAG: A/G-specific adenine glycosylase, partial [Clostridia bacterium]|nr:A/G-specific adenine glycosylase [Clostridia bacterium]